MRNILGELAQAISEGLEKSERILATVRKLEELGYDLSLYLEATILLTREGEGEAGKGGRKGGRKTVKRIRSGALKLSDKDLKFLKSLKIALHEKERG